MFCPNCGTEVTEGAFCPKCGTKIAGDVVQNVNQATNQQVTGEDSVKQPEMKPQAKPEQSQKKRSLRMNLRLRRSDKERNTAVRRKMYGIYFISDDERGRNDAGAGLPWNRDRARDHGRQSRRGDRTKSGNKE